MDERETHRDDGHANGEHSDDVRDRDGVPRAAPGDGTDRTHQAMHGGVDRMVRNVLIVGVVVGMTLLGVGLVLTLAGRGGLADTSLRAGPALRAAVHGRAEGFYSLGLLALILTPFVRVIGSIVAFTVLREWRFVAVTSAVLCVMIASIVVGAA